MSTEIEMFIALIERTKSRPEAQRQTALMSICACDACGLRDYCTALSETIELCDYCLTRIRRFEFMIERMPGTSIDDVLTRTAYEVAQDTAVDFSAANGGEYTFRDFHAIELARIKRALAFREAARK